MEVLVLVDFEGSMKDELEVHVGDVVKKVTKAPEEGWLQGELKGKRGIFPSNFVKEVPVYLIGDSKREPRSVRTSRTAKQQTRKCEVVFAYSRQNADELELVAGDTVEIVREIEDGWWMGSKNGEVGAFPSNFVKEIYITPKDEGKIRPKLSEALFNKEIKQTQRASVRNKITDVQECCQVMFDYTGLVDDELTMKKGDLVKIISKETEDEGWWEGEVNGRRGLLPRQLCHGDSDGRTAGRTGFKSGNWSQAPARHDTQPTAAKGETTAMETKQEPSAPDQKEEIDSKDLRSDPPNKVMLPGLRKAPPPPVKDKPHKFVPNKANGELPKQTETEKDSEQLDVVEVSSEKLTHPTANRAKPPGRRPPSTLLSSPGAAEDDQKMEQPAQAFKLPSPLRPVLPKITAPNHDEPDDRLAAKPHRPIPEEDGLRAEVRELSMALELLKNRELTDIDELKAELKEERAKRMALQDEVLLLKKSFNNH
ncbi:hypothetical protein SKAU_G00331290 [Synaphobranchus kaupii]|uniref:SH3 domain-containing protein n=1 Tax=Synaphobranchus kaupii TaxID=118154 RepID=A0A9Q1EL76_SYNKA|nr:hypothetical protein SKAU_G00331290 [Synaphobranchus kaupii]